MRDVFIAYASRDRERASLVAEALLRKGLTVWWDLEIKPGLRFRERIGEAMAKAECVVVLWSEAAVVSDWVKDEADEASAQGKLIPVLIEEVSPPLGHRQFEAARLIRWNGEVDDREFLNLVETIRERLSLQTRVDGAQKPSAGGCREAPHATQPGTQPTPTLWKPEDLMRLVVVVTACLLLSVIVLLAARDGASAGWPADRLQGLLRSVQLMGLITLAAILALLLKVAIQGRRDA